MKAIAIGYPSGNGGLSRGASVQNDHIGEADGAKQSDTICMST